eukprot:360772-Chlamydomonas_euryale.AAC.11
MEPLRQHWLTTPPALTWGSPLWLPTCQQMCQQVASVPDMPMPQRPHHGIERGVSGRIGEGRQGTRRPCAPPFFITPAVAPLPPPSFSRTPDISQQPKGSHSTRAWR